jgi:hypothetical protein
MHKKSRYSLTAHDMRSSAVGGIVEDEAKEEGDQN